MLVAAGRRAAAAHPFPPERIVEHGRDGLRASTMAGRLFREEIKNEKG